MVTFGAVAAMTGLGGYLAAYPPDGTAAAQAAPPPEAAPPEAAPPEVAGPETTIPLGTGRDDPARGGERTQRREADATPVPEQAPQAPPVYSAPSEVPAAAESRGS